MKRISQAFCLCVAAMLCATSGIAAEHTPSLKDGLIFRRATACTVRRRTACPFGNAEIVLRELIALS